MLITNRDKKLGSILSAELSGAKGFSVASAYVSPGACELLQLIDKSRKYPVRVCIGRAMKDGLTDAACTYLARLDKEARGMGGGVRVDNSLGWHSKLYRVESSGARSFIGSSNFTPHGLGTWTEATLEVDSTQGELIGAEIDRLWNSCVDISDVLDTIPRIEPVLILQKKGSQDIVLEVPEEPGQLTEVLRLSLLTKIGGRTVVAPKSGLNWFYGGGRERDFNECYIRFPVVAHEKAEYVFGSIHKGTKFLAHTHTGRTMTMQLEGSSKRGDTIAKQISSAGEKKSLGDWFKRECLKLKSQESVTLEMLEAYGRTTVDFHRIGTATNGQAIVYMDFSVPGA